MSSTNPFRDRVINLIKAWEHASPPKRLYADFYGVRFDVPTPNVDTADAIFWYPEDECIAVVFIAEQVSAELYRRAVTAVAALEAVEPPDDAGFLRAVVIVPTRKGLVAHIAPDGYEIDEMFGTAWCSAFGVWKLTAQS